MSFQHTKTAMDSDNFNNNNNNNNNNRLNESVIDLRLFFFPQVGCRWLLFYNDETVYLSSSCDDRDSELRLSLS